MGDTAEECHAICKCTLDDCTAIFIVTIGLERKQFTTDFIEITTQWLNLADVVIALVQCAISLLVKRDLDEWRLSIAMSINKGINDFP